MGVKDKNRPGTPRTDRRRAAGKGVMGVVRDKSKINDQDENWKHSKAADDSSVHGWKKSLTKICRRT